MKIVSFQNVDGQNVHVNEDMIVGALPVPVGRWKVWIQDMPPQIVTPAELTNIQGQVTG